MRHEQSSVFGFTLAPLTYDEVILLVVEGIKARRKILIDTTNTMVLSMAVVSKSLADALSAFDYLVPDSVPLSWYIAITSGIRKEPCYGPEFMQQLLLKRSALGTVVVIGGTDSTRKTIESKYHIRAHWWTSSVSMSDPLSINQVITFISDHKPDCVLLALGCPKQHILASYISAHIKKGVVLGIGGSLDMISGKTVLPPKRIRSLGLGWLFRLAMEPNRLFKRYAVFNTLFLFLALKNYYHDRYMSYRSR